MNRKTNSAIRRKVWVVVFGLVGLSGILAIVSCGNKNAVPVEPSQGMNLSVSMQSTGAAKSALLGATNNEVYYNISGPAMAPVTGVVGPFPSSGNTGTINFSLLVPQGTARLMAFQINDASTHQPLALGAVQSDISAQPVSLIVEMGSLVRNCYNLNTSAFAAGSYFNFGSENLADAVTVIGSPTGYDIGILPVSPGVFQINALSCTVAYMGSGNFVNFAMAPTTGYVTNSAAAKQAAGASITNLQAGDVFCFYSSSPLGHAWMQIINVGSPTTGPTFQYRINTTLPYYAYQQTMADIAGPCATPVPLSIGEVVSTLAGSGVQGSVNGTGTAASFFAPFGVAVDPSGNVYVGERSNNMIRKIGPTGVVTTLAGQLASGSTDGLGTTALFYAPEGVALDSAGNLYVADSQNETIRKITPAGVVSTLAGIALTSGVTNGPAATATFNFPTGVAVDSAGNVYVADNQNEMIREISTAGIVTTLAGSGTIGATNGPGAIASFSAPYQVAVDAAGNVYVADAGNQLIRQIAPGGVVTTLAGTGTAGFVNGPVNIATFSNPEGIAVDSSGNIYVVDEAGELVRKISGGIVTTVAGTAGTAGSSNGIGTAASFSNPQGIAVDASGVLYIADANDNLIRKIN